MDKELYRNGSGYADPTAYKALQNYQKGEQNMEYKRGEIFKYKIGYDYKPALVVSADYRANDNILNIIVLTDEEKRDSVQIVCNGIKYADCSFISYGYAGSFGSFIRKATDAEMEAIDAGITKSLGLEMQVVELPTASVAEVIAPLMEEQVEVPWVKIAKDELEELIKGQLDSLEGIASAKTEASIYKNLYEQLLAKVMDRGC